MPLAARRQSGAESRECFYQVGEARICRRVLNEPIQLACCPLEEPRQTISYTWIVSEGRFRDAVDQHSRGFHADVVPLRRQVLDDCKIVAEVSPKIPHETGDGSL